MLRSPYRTGAHAVTRAEAARAAKRLKLSPTMMTTLNRIHTTNGLTLLPTISAGQALEKRGLATIVNASINAVELTSAGRELAAGLAGEGEA